MVREQAAFMKSESQSKRKEAFDKHTQRINEMSSMGLEERKYRIAKLLEQTPSKMRVKELNINREQSSSTNQIEEKTNHSNLAGEDRMSFNTGKSDLEEKLKGLIPNKQSLSNMEKHMNSSQKRFNENKPQVAKTVMQQAHGKSSSLYDIYGKNVYTRGNNSKRTSLQSQQPTKINS